MGFCFRCLWSLLCSVKQLPKKKVSLRPLVLTCTSSDDRIHTYSMSHTNKSNQTKLAKCEHTHNYTRRGNIQYFSFYKSCPDSPMNMKKITKSSLLLYDHIHRKFSLWKFPVYSYSKFCGACLSARTIMACWTSVLQCSHMFFKILLAALWRAVVVDLEATVSG